MLLFALACAVSHEGPYNLQLVDTTSDCAVPPTGAAEVTIVVSRRGDHWWVDPLQEDCAGDASTFTCDLPAFASSASYADAGVDATVRSALRHDGEWDADGRLTTTATHSVSCTGADCGALGSTAPEACTTTWTYTEAP